MPKRDRPDTTVQLSLASWISEGSWRGYLLGDCGRRRGVGGRRPAGSSSAWARKVPITLKINGANKSLSLEPRVTLLML